MHTHDIEPYKDDFLVSASHDGFVFRVFHGSRIECGGDWVRGLAVEGDRVYIGHSPVQKRSRRHKSVFDGKITVHRFDEEVVPEYELKVPRAGQINDLFILV